MLTYNEKMKPWLEGNRPFSAAEIRKTGIPSQILVELTAKGTLEHVVRGIYLPTQTDVTENLSLQMAALAMPSTVVCLLSALRFHNFTTQLPQERYLAIQAHAWIPRRDAGMAVRIFTLGKEVFQFGIEEHWIDGVKIKVYSPAKTVADCFKFRNKIGQDIAIEALKEGWRKKLFTVNELIAAANICRVSRVIMPYMEAILQ